MVSEDVPHGSPGGLGRHALTLARALAEAGSQVDFLGNGQIGVERLPADLKPPGAFFPGLGQLPGGWKERAMGAFNPYRRPYYARRYARAIRRLADDYDVVHYHGHLPNIGHYLPASINFVQTRHDQGGDCLLQVRFRRGQVCTALSPAACAGCAAREPNALQRMLSAWSVRVVRRQTGNAFRRHKTIFVSEMLQRNWERIAGRGPWGRVSHNFVDSAAIETALGGETPPGTGVQVFMAAKLWEAKGVGSLLAHMLGRIPPGMHVVIAGDGPDEGTLRQLYASERVEFLGWRAYAEVLRRSARATVLVVPSICEESCATSVLEGLALGRPVLALARGGTPELRPYERYPGQLRLFPDVPELAEGLLSWDAVRSGQEARAAGHVPSPRVFSGDVARALPQILEIYRMRRKEWRTG